MTDSYTRIIDRLKPCRRILLTTHIRPDGDALGSTAAMSLGLRKVNIEPHILLLSHLPSKYAFIYRENNIHYTDLESTSLSSFDLSPFDALLVLDTGTWSQLPGLREKLAGWDKPKLVVDHHLTQENWADEKLVVTEAAAAAEIVAGLLERWNIPLDKSIATCLFLGIVSDTGWFQFSNTRPYTMRLAATLKEAGVDADAIYQLLYQNERAERIALQTRALQTLQLLAGGRLAVMRLSKADFEQTRAGMPDTENVINIPLQIASVEASILVTEPMEPAPPAPIRISLRSKGKIDVARFAEQFGGGGHARAAGLKIEATFAEAYERVAGAMVKALAECDSNSGS